MYTQKKKEENTNQKSKSHKRERKENIALFISSPTYVETRLEKTLDIASLQVDIDVEVAGSGGEAGDGLDIGRFGVEVSSAGGEANVADGDGEAGGGALEVLVVGEGVLRLDASLVLSS